MGGVTMWIQGRPSHGRWGYLTNPAHKHVLQIDGLSWFTDATKIDRKPGVAVYANGQQVGVFAPDKAETTGHAAFKLPDSVASSNVIDVEFRPSNIDGLQDAETRQGIAIKTIQLLDGAAKKF